MRQSLLAAGYFVALSCVASAQIQNQIQTQIQPQIQIQTIEGVVVHSITGKPLAGAYVNTGGPHTTTIVSDEKGHFQLASITPVNVLFITRTGFLRQTQRVVAGRGQNPQSLRVQLTPESVIFGKLIDDDGFPFEMVLVQAMEYRTVNGQRRLVLSPVLGGRSNDRGDFRIAGLTAGRYYLRAGAGVGDGWMHSWDVRYAAQFYPGSVEPGDDSAIEVSTGEEHGPLEFHVKRQQGVVVAGRITMPAGRALPLGKCRAQHVRSQRAVRGRRRSTAGRHVLPSSRPAWNVLAASANVDYAKGRRPARRAAGPGDHHRYARYHAATS